MKEHTYATNVEFQGVGLYLSSANAEFIDFVKRFVEFPCQDGRETGSQITVNVSFDKCCVVPDHCNKVARNVFSYGDTIFLLGFGRSEEFDFKIKIFDEKLDIDVFVSRKRAGFFPKAGWPRHEFMACVYFFIYVPYFYYFERFKKKYVLHSAAFEYDRKGAVLSGLGGVGKSTVCLGALSSQSSKLLSDHLLFYDAQNIYPLPGPIALDEPSVKALKGIKDKLLPKAGMHYRKRAYYSIGPELLCAQTEPKCFFWLQQGTGYEVLAVSKEDYTSCLMNINLLSGHIRDYYVFAAALDLVGPRSFSFSVYYDTLYQLLSDAKCYIVKFKPEYDVAMVLNMVRERMV